MIVTKTQDTLTKPQESDLEIDSDRLDYEWVRQPKLFFRYAEALAKARAKYDAAKAAFELAEVEIATKVRTNPDKYGADKITEGVVKELIPQQAAYKEAQQKVLKAKYQVELFDAAVKALDNKKKGLESLVTLAGMDYHSNPKAKGDSAKKLTERYEKQAARGRLNSRKE